MMQIGPCGHKTLGDDTRSKEIFYDDFMTILCNLALWEIQFRPGIYVSCLMFIVMLYERVSG